MSLIEDMTALYLQCANEEPRPIYHYAWCSVCGLRGLATVYGDQKDWCDHPASGE